MAIKKVVIKLELPELSAEALKFIGKTFKGFVPAFILTAFAVCWRAQIANSQSDSNIAKSELQRIPSMKFTAKLFNHPLVTQLLTALAIYNSSLFDQKEYVATPAAEREGFVQRKIQEVTESGVKAKILTPRQIGNSEDLNTHRRGLVAKYRGILQASALYESDKIIKGINISYLTCSQLFDVLINTLQKSSDLSITQITSSIEEEWGTWMESETEDVMELKTPDDQSDWTGYKPADTPLEDRLGDDLKRIICKDNELAFEDGLVMSEAETNIVPLESVLDVIRAKPAVLTVMEINPDEQDPFLLAAAEQIKQIKKTDAKLISAPKGGRTKKRKKSNKGV